MKITNSQVKALIKVYEMINNARYNNIPISDISNNKTIKRFELVLNHILYERITDNEQLNDYYANTRKELFRYDR